MEAPIPNQTDVPVQAADNVHSAVPRVQIPLDFDSYEPEEYDCPADPYDITIIDDEPEVLSSDVGSDDESKHAKARHVLRKLKRGEYDRFFASNLYKCPFCKTKSLKGNDFYALVTHGETVNTAPSSLNRTAFIAQHRALGRHLRDLQRVAIAEGRMPPIKPKEPKPKGLGSRKYQKRQREEAEAWRRGGGAAAH